MVCEIEGDIGDSLLEVVVDVSVTASDDSRVATRVGVRISKVVSPVDTGAVRVV